MKSSIIEGMLKEELERNERMTRRYEAELAKLPKGTIIKRKINAEEYCYLTHREGKKVISTYLGKTCNVDLEELNKQIENRKKIVSIIRKLKVEKKELKKILK